MVLYITASIFVCLFGTDVMVEELLAYIYIVVVVVVVVSGCESRLTSTEYT